MPPGKWLWAAAGGLAFALGAVGIVLPLLPTVPFWLLAAFCFSKSHPAWAERLYQHPRYGLAMREWRDRRVISRRAKVLALSTMTLGAAVTWFTLGPPGAYGAIAVMAASGTWIATRRE